MFFLTSNLKMFVTIHEELITLEMAAEEKP